MLKTIAGLLPLAAGLAVANPFDMAKSWLVMSVGLDVGVPAGWWQPLVIGSTVASLLSLAAFLTPGLILGVAINAVLLWLVLASIWAPGGVARAAIV